MAPAELESYLSARLDLAVTGTEVLHDGLNLSLAISTEDDEHAYVLRRPNELRHTDLFVDLRQEYRLLQRLQAAEVPTPAPVLFCDDASFLGDRFFVTTHLDGAAIASDSDLPERFRDEPARTCVADRLIDTLADIHSLDVGPFEDACERMTPREQVDRALERLDRTASVTGRELPSLRSTADWLLQEAPSDPMTTLVHGDFRPGNVLFAGRDRPELAGVLDWETAMLGDPRTELGYLLLRWRDDDDPMPPLDGLEARCSNEDAIRQLRELNERGLSPLSSSPGSPRRRELVARYEDETGISFENDAFYRAHSALMLATVWEDLHRHRIQAGAESTLAPLVDYLSMIAASIVDGELPL